MTLRLFCALVLGLTLGALASGCSDSHEGDGNDSGILLPDANLPDGGGPRPDGGPDAGPPPPMCGNGRIEPGESCDDHNLADGDGCSMMCTWEARCGDMHLDPGEVCDDGGHLSGDGCRSDCLSNETCGNHIIDYARGEVCDGTAGCSTDCHTLASCGNMVIDAPEQCDNDLNTPAHRWDGCGADCRTEHSMVLENLAFADATMGCDYSGDGMVDNRFASALGSGLGLLNMLFMGGGGGGPTILLSYMGLDDAMGANDPDLRTAWLTGQPGTTMGSYTVDMASLNADGSPMTSLQTSIMAHALLGGPEDIDLNLGFLPLTLHEAYLRGTTTVNAGVIDGMTNTTICGVVQSQLFSIVSETLVESFGGMGGFMIDIPPPCDGSTSDSTLVDWLAGGARIAIITIRATQPDVDLDGDGLEVYEITGHTTGPACQPVITACIDGDGTRVEGRDCYNDMRFQDGYSAAMTGDAVHAVITGVN
jgi:cysteine-rich repeat protein